MAKITITLFIILITTISAIAQKADTVYLNNKYKPVEASKARYMKINSVHDNIETRRFIDLKEKTETVKHHKNNQPVGKWVIVEYNGRVVEYNFDELLYLTADELKKETEQVNGTIADNTPGFTKPSFPGGDEARIKYLQSIVDYPQEAKENGYQGTVFVSFLITKDGNIENVSVPTGSNPHLAVEAVKVVKSMPKWNPATLNGEPIDYYHTMPLKFTLAG